MTPKMRARLAAIAARQWAIQLGDPEVALAFVNGEFGKSEVEATVDDISARLDNLYLVAVDIADLRREKLKRLKDALLMNDDGTALRIAAALCGVRDDDEEGNRTKQSIH